MSGIILTRYLYNLDDVRHSLFIEILRKNYKAALHWCYELYWSGYKEETFEFLINNLYNEIFDKNEEFEERIKKEYEEWKKDNNKDEKIGNITINLCFRNYEISRLISEYFKINCKEKIENKPEETKLYINLKKKDIEDYSTKYGERGRRYKVLKEVCKYQLSSQYSKIFQGEIRKKNQKELLINNWEYYAYKSPYWKEAFEEYGGKVKQGKIVFDNDELLEGFYNKYDLEIDEQSQEVQDIVFGINNEKQKTILQFTKEFNGVIKTSKLKKKVNIN